MSESPFGSWTGRDLHAMFPGVALHSIGGEQVPLPDAAPEMIARLDGVLPRPRALA